MKDKMLINNRLRFVGLTCGALAALLLIGGCGSSEPQKKPVPAGAWQTHRGGWERKGVSAATPLVRAPELIWQRELEYAVNSSPVAKGDSIYFGSKDYGVYALNYRSGDQLFTFETEGNVEGAITVTADSIYFGSEDNNLYALDNQTGAVKWVYPTGMWVHAAPVVANDTVYFGSLDQKFYALDEATGAVKWDFAQRKGYFNAGAAYADGRLYVSSYNAMLYCLSAQDGSELWRFWVGAFGRRPPSLHNGVVYLATVKNDKVPLSTIYAVDAECGKMIWSFKTEDNQTFSTALVTTDEVIYYGSFEGYIGALDAKTGKQLWQYQLDSWPSSPVLAGDYLYFGTGRGQLICLNAKAGGELVWELELAKDSIWTTPLLWRGMIYVGSKDNNLYALGYKEEQGPE